MLLSSTSGLYYNNRNNSSASKQQDNASELSYKIFCLVWAIATLFHMAKSRIFTNDLLHVLLALAAITLIFKPSSLTRLLVFLSLQILEAFILMPNVSNHWLFSTLVNLTIIQTLLYLVIKKRSFKVNKAEFIETFAPLVRIELIILYFFSVFHKLNTSFFIPGSSCASELFMKQNSYGLLPNSTTILLLTAYATVIIETLIPLLLLFRKTRNYGLLIGLLFHNIIAYNPHNPYFDFSSAIFALYFLFTDQNFSNQVNKVYLTFQRNKLLWQEQLQQFYTIKNLVYLTGVILLGMSVIAFLSLEIQDYFRYVFWTAYSLVYIAIFVWAMFGKEREVTSNKRYFSTPYWSLLLFPLIVLLNGFSPYLGLKTETSFAMFSNLRTEGGISNHLIVPANSQLFGFQKDVVEIVSSSDPKLQKVADEKKLLVFFRFKNYVAGKKPVHITYIRNGQQHVFERATASKKDELMQMSPFLLRKFLKFRYVNIKEPQPCAH